MLGGVLHRYGRNGRGCKATVCRDGFDVGLNARTASRIATRNREDSLVLSFIHSLKMGKTFAPKIYLSAALVPLDFGLAGRNFTNGVEGKIDLLCYLFGGGEQ